MYSGIPYSTLYPLPRAGGRLLLPDRAALVLLHGLRWEPALRRAQPVGQLAGSEAARESREWAAELSLLVIHAAVLLAPQVRAASWTLCHF